MIKSKHIEPALPNPSLGKGVLFVRNEDEALREMRFRAECDVQPVCAPPDCSPIYYISEKGKLFIFRPYKGYYVIYEKERRLNNGRTPIYELMITNGKDRTINIEKLVYCTFVLGEYIDKLKIEFKDGNPLNFDVSNLQVKNLLNEDCARRMYGYTEEYKKSFKYVAAYLAYFLGIADEDAQDVAQDAFLNMLARKHEQKARDFVALWIADAVQIGVNLWNKKTRFQSIDYMEREPGKIDVPFGLDVIEVLGNTNMRKCLDLQLQGASMKEIAEETGIPFKAIGSHITRAKRKLRKYLLTDPEIARIYTNNQ